MESISFQIPLGPMTLNHSHRIVKFGKRAARIKTDDFSSWEKEFAYWLQEYSDLKTHFQAGYVEKKHSICLEMFVYLNDKKFFTKPKNKSDFSRISKNSGDISNMIKTSEDQIFRWLGVDDSQVTRVIAEKIPTNSKDPTMVFRVSLQRRPESFLVSPQ
jgi:Holliday junction resolvase RusA-like endonuclease